MAKANFEITFEIESMVKLACLATKCKYNLIGKWGLGCNLKQIELSENGVCRAYEPLETTGKRTVVCDSDLTKAQVRAIADQVLKDMVERLRRVGRDNMTKAQGVFDDLVSSLST